MSASWGADWFDVPRERGRFLEHRKRRVRRRAVVRLCRRFRQWCRLVRAGVIALPPFERDYYSGMAAMPLAELVRDELREREQRRKARQIYERLRVLSNPRDVLEAVGSGAIAYAARN